MIRQTKEPLPEYRLSTSNRAASEFANSMREFLDLNPPYQRQSVWTYEQRVNLVKSWIQGIPVPAVTLNDRATEQWREANGEDVRLGKAMLGVVDGKQRIETALMWFSGEFTVPATWFTPEFRVFPAEHIPHVSYKNLSRAGQLYMARGAALPVIEARLPSIKAEAELFLILNGGGTSQTEADMERAEEVARW